MPIDIDAEVIANTRLSDDYNVVALAAPEIASLARPGQFLMVKPIVQRLGERSPLYIIWVVGPRKALLVLWQRSRGRGRGGCRSLRLLAGTAAACWRGAGAGLA